MIASTPRDTELRDILTTRQHEMQGDVQRRIRHGRTDRPVDVGDDLERSDASSQGDIDFALLQMRTETLTRIDGALIRLDAGTYGSCVECQDDIAERRLRALPFAARCQACEGQREQAQEFAQHIAQRSGPSLFADMVSS